MEHDAIQSCTTFGQALAEASEAYTAKKARHMRLSKALHAVSLANMKKLAQLHNSNYHRLMVLKETDVERGSEYDVLLRYIKANPNLRYLIAVEYEFDDGGREQGHGDALFYDGERLYVTECKYTRRMCKREQRVREQARKYVERLRSWLAHLGRTDTALEKLASREVVASCVTEEGKFEILE
jgi:hypothetical protein